MATSAAPRSGVRSERDLERLILAAAVDRDRHLGPGRVLAQHVLQRMRIVDRLAIDLGDDVLDLDPRAVCRRPGRDRGDHGADHEPVGGGGGLIDLVVGDAQEGTVDVSGLDQLVGDVPGGVAIQREAEAWARLRLLDRKVHADDLAAGVQERTTAVARVDLSVRLNGVEDVFHLARRGVRDRDEAVERADDALGNAVLLAQRAPDRDGELANLERVRVAPAQRRQFLCVDLDDRDVVLRAGADDAGIEFLRPITQDDLELPGVFDDMVVRHDVAIGADDKTGADSMLLRLEDHVRRRDRGLDFHDRLAILVGDADHRRLFGDVVGDGSQWPDATTADSGRRHFDQARGHENRCRGTGQGADQRADHHDPQHAHPAARRGRLVHRHGRQGRPYRRARPRPRRAGHRRSGAAPPVSARDARAARARARPDREPRSRPRSPRVSLWFCGRRYAVEHAAQGLGRAEQAGGFHGYNKLGVLAVGELRERVELQDGDKDRIGGGVLDRLIDRFYRLGPAFRLEDGRLPEAFGAQDGRLLIAFSRLDLRLLLAVGDVDLGLLLPFGFEDEGALLLVGRLLQRQAVQDHLRRGDVDDLDTVDPDAPLVGDRLHLRLQLRVDPLPLAERVVQAHPAEDGAQCGARELVDGDEVIANAEQGKLGVDDLAEDGGIDAHGDVVARNDVLFVAGSGRLTDVDQHHRVNERHQEGQTGLADRMELADARDHADVTLLDDGDGAGDDDDGEEHQDGADDQGCGHALHLFSDSRG